MGCCGCRSEKLKNGKDDNNEYEKIEKDARSKVKTILTAVIVGVLIVGLLFVMI